MIQSYWTPAFAGVTTEPILASEFLIDSSVNAVPSVVKTK